MENNLTIEQKHAQIFERVKEKLKLVNVKLVTMFSDDLQPHQIYQNSIWLIAEKSFLKEIIFLGNDIELCLDYIEKVKKENYCYWWIDKGILKQKFSSKGTNPYDNKFEEARLMTCLFWETYFVRNKKIYEEFKANIDFNGKLAL
jgi:hypothetical protein